MINSNRVTYHNEHNQTTYPFDYYKMCVIQNNIVENENNQIKNIINSHAKC
jgi:predicted metal-dependent peptidase